MIIKMQIPLGEHHLSIYMCEIASAPALKSCKTDLSEQKKPKEQMFPICVGACELNPII